MTVTYSGRVTRTTDLLGDLYELVNALDRRVRHLDRPGESRIAFEAADLRERAISLIRQIEGNDRQQ